MMSPPNLSLIDESSLALTPLDTHDIPVARLRVATAPVVEAAILLALAAEVEHATMTQYLYAAYAVRRPRDPGPLRNQSALLRRFMLQLAREEMGHLMTVQNLLRLIGVPLYLGGTAESIHRSTLPFRYTLEPLSTRSLAKYITAERPAYVADLALRHKLDCIADIAQEANGGQPLRHIGAIYARLSTIFSSAALDDRQFHDDTEELQARWADWGYDDTDRSQHHSRKVLVCPAAIAGPPMDTGSLRDQALAALRNISEQGEGYPDVADCHYQRLLHLYDMVAGPESRGFSYGWPVAVNPTTRPVDPAPHQDPPGGQPAIASYIESARSRTWAELFNLRYQLLLGYTWHFLHSPGPRYHETSEASDISDTSERLGDYTPRGLLLRGAFDEMRHLRKIAMKLVTMPLRDGDASVNAGPTFELGAVATGVAAPPPGPWSHHLALLRASTILIQALLPSDAPPNPFLQDLGREDRRTTESLEALAAHRPIPDHLHPRKFEKVVSIVEQAARGFTIPGHGNFWTGVTCPEFAALSFYGMRYLGYDASAPERYCASTSLFFEAVGGAMPRFRPPIPASRQAFIRWWIDAQAPDNDPPDRIGAHHERSAIDDDEPE